VQSVVLAESARDMKPLFYCVAALLLIAGVANVSTATDITPAFKKEIMRGQNAAMVPQSYTFPSRAIPYLTNLQKRYEKESKAFRLGFAMTALSHMLTAQQFALSLPPEELQQAGVGYTIFSSEATILKIQLHLTDAQMVELFGSDLARGLKKPNAPL